MEEKLEEDFLRTIKRIFDSNTSVENVFSSLVKIKLPYTNSKIIRKNHNVIYCSKITNMEGLFNKENDDTKLFGRYLCDLAKSTLNCEGFFTSDELPRYGIKKKEVRAIFSTLNKKIKDGDLILIYAYNREQSDSINSFISNYINEKIRKLYSSDNLLEKTKTN